MTTAPLLALLASALLAPVDAPTTAGTPNAVIKSEPVDVVERLNERVPLDLPFLDGYQNKVRLGELLQAGKPVVLTMVYFDCPMLCSTILNGLVKGLNEAGLDLGKDFTALTVSFSPKDSPRESAMYQAGYLKRLSSAAKAHAQDWLFLTGSSETIKQLTDAVGFQYRWDAPTQQYEHPAVVVVLTPDGRISRYLYGVQFPTRDLRLAVVEASGGKVGTSFDRVLLKCFRYDPTSRSYNLYAILFVRIGAGLFGLALAALLVVLWRRDLKKGSLKAPNVLNKGTAA